ncbi:hypothetical protein Hypma_001303 [Hypsizygus marmoreus]|uniref:Uncharacterized protein n=1 Tax=Hypsizygus marmoreus TaxID=39966 RepID=A0A369KB70_HYPMA|nr:hypothetical protein Hypma_001303 [Hypsizygus marmoreus]
MEHPNISNTSGSAVDQHGATAPTLIQPSLESPSDMTPALPSSPSTVTHRVVKESTIPSPQPTPTFNAQAAPHVYPTSPSISTPAPRDHPASKFYADFIYQGERRTSNLTFYGSRAAVLREVPVEKQAAVRQSLSDMLENLDAPTHTHDGERLLDWGWRMFLAETFPDVEIDYSPTEEFFTGFEKWYKDITTQPVAATPSPQHCSTADFRQSRLATTTGMYGTENSISVPAPLLMPAQNMNQSLVDTVPHLPASYRAASPALPSPRLSVSRGPTPALPGTPGIVYHNQTLDMGPMPVSIHGGSGPPPRVRPYLGHPTPTLSPMPVTTFRSPLTTPSMSMGPSSTLPSQTMPYNASASASPAPSYMQGTRAPSLPMSPGVGSYLPVSPGPSTPAAMHSPLSTAPTMPATFPADHIFLTSTPEDMQARYGTAATSTVNCEKNDAPDAVTAEISGSTSAAMGFAQGSKRKRHGDEEQNIGRIVLPRNEGTMKTREDGSALRRSALTRAASQNGPPGQWDFQTHYPPGP